MWLQYRKPLGDRLERPHHAAEGTMRSVNAASYWPALPPMGTPDQIEWLTFHESGAACQVDAVATSRD
ncbi:MAG: hypothetical protein ACLP51_07330 [Syntrophobacteraceae bacterium]